MKKVLVIMTVITVVMMALTGCSEKWNEGNVTPALSDMAYKSETKLKEIMIATPDGPFWGSADRGRELIEKTVEDRVGFNISFRLESSHGEEIILEDVYATSLTYINDVWRRYLSSEVMQALAKSRPVVKAHKEGESLEITGIIMKWQQPAKLLDSEKRVFSVVDLSGDGAWDYVTEGKIYFASESDAVSLKDENGKHLGIDEVEIRRTKLVEMEEEEDLTFDKLAKLALSES